MLQFPCRAFKENRIILSKEELFDKLKEAKTIGKSCEVGFYAFSVWENMNPVIESVVLDKIIYKGEKETLEKLAERKCKEGIESILIFDGEKYLLFVKESVEKLSDLFAIKEPGTTVVTEVDGKFTYPGYENLKTGQVSKIIRKWKGNEESSVD